jgi:CheY-like chemotaxis protein
VENDNDTAKLIEKYLKKLGYILVGIATTGEEAINKLEECKPDLVLMDIQLDGMTCPQLMFHMVC